MRAVYEAGVRKPQQKLDLADGEEVELTIHRRPNK
ncbi:MAG: antitoxin family protein [Terriglobia bacterium]